MVCLDGRATAPEPEGALDICVGQRLNYA
ncbi:hypothetical protein LCGC14_2979280, partial [marine sediment metagenome]